MYAEASAKEKKSVVEWEQSGEREWMREEEERDRESLQHKGPENLKNGVGLLSPEQKIWVH